MFIIRSIKWPFLERLLFEQLVRGVHGHIVSLVNRYWRSPECATTTDALNEPAWHVCAHSSVDRNKGQHKSQLSETPFSLSGQLNDAFYSSSIHPLHSSRHLLLFNDHTHSFGGVRFQNTHTLRLDLRRADGVCSMQQQISWAFISWGSLALQPAAPLL